MRFLAGIALVVLTGSTASAHDARPLSITLVEQTTGVYRVSVRPPPSLDPDQLPVLAWPAECDLHDGGSGYELHRPGVSTSLLTCSGGLADRTLRVDYATYNPSISTLIRLETLSGISLTTVLPPDENSWTVPPAPDRLSIAGEYSRLGFEHIWKGPDHLLFVAGLLLLAASPRRVVWAVTGFTAAHSITLSLAALSVVRVPIAPTEALIALSIVFLAAEIARRNPASLSRRYPVLLSFGFGLLHGFGFASALAEIGLPATEVATGLLFFNIGVEIGQLAFIVVATLGLLLLRRLRAFTPRATQSRRYDLMPVSAYFLGMPAAFWFFERTVSAFS